MTIFEQEVPHIEQIRPEFIDRAVAENPETLTAGTIHIFSSEDTVFGDEVKHAARVLQTDVYLEAGIITPDDLDEDGIYTDEYVDRATYFYVANGTKDTAARQIAADKKAGIASLPTVKHFECDPEVLKSAAGVDRLSDIKPADVVEISGLSSRKTVAGKKEGDMDAMIALYSQLLRNSVESGHKLWIQNIEPKFVRRLSFLIGADQIHVLGDAQAYMGEPTIPVAINPSAIVKQKLTSEDPKDDMHKEHLAKVFAGINVDKVPKDMRKVLRESNIPTFRSNSLKRGVRNPMIMAQIGIGTYSAARAIPASFVDEFDGNIAALWGIDVATSVPYVWGMFKAFTGKKVGEKVLGAAVAIPSFLAPYAYWYAQGEKYPPAVNVVVGGFVVGAVGAEVAKQKRARNRDAQMRDELLSEEH